MSEISLKLSKTTFIKRAIKEMNTRNISYDKEYNKR